jgi:hypothetical protein
VTLSPPLADLITGALSFFFTVALLSYLLGDNPLYRAALHLFIGVSVGYVMLVVVFQVLGPRLVDPLLSGNPFVIALMAVPVVLFLLLLFKLTPRYAALGNVSVAYMMGVGAAIAVGGAITGTLIPQVGATWLSLWPGSPGGALNNAILLLGTIAALLSFQFWLGGAGPDGEPRRKPLMAAIGSVGRAFVVIALGAVYGGLILSGIAVFSGQLSTLAGWVAGLR